jgi:amino acid permease
VSKREAFPPGYPRLSGLPHSHWHWQLLEQLSQSQVPPQQLDVTVSFSFFFFAFGIVFSLFGLARYALSKGLTNVPAKHYSAVLG